MFFLCLGFIELIGFFFIPKEFIWVDLGMGKALHLKEGLGPFGSETWLVLAMQDPVGQWER